MLATESKINEFYVNFHRISPSFYLDIDTEDAYEPALVTQWGVSLDFAIDNAESNNVHTVLSVDAPIIVGFPRLVALYILVRDPDVDDDADSATSDGGDGGDGNEEDEQDEEDEEGDHVVVDEEDGEEEVVDADAWNDTWSLD